MTTDKPAGAKVVERIVKDPGFRREFLANPKATLEKELNVKFDPGVKIEVHQDTDLVRHFVIPEFPKGTEELSELELKKVAGGGTICCTCGAWTHQTLSCVVQK